VNLIIRVHTGRGKLEKVREFEWSWKVRENAKVTGKSGKFWGKILPFCTAVVMLIIVALESIHHTVSSSSMATLPYC